MYCPHCGQEQAPSQESFCTRCGFRVRGVAVDYRAEVVKAFLLILWGPVLYPFIRGFVVGIVGAVTDGTKSFDELISATMVLNAIAILAFLWGVVRVVRVLLAMRVEREGKPVVPDSDLAAHSSQTRAHTERTIEGMPIQQVLQTDGTSEAATSVFEKRVDNEAQ